jgi:ribonuclease VapC
VIVVDSSALVAVLVKEAWGERCRLVLEAQSDIAMSCATVTEALIVAARRGIAVEMETMITAFVTQFVELTSARAKLAALAYSEWGKGAHPASLNYGDCFAYATAKEFDCPLLYVGNDFALTDIASAIVTGPTAM